MNEEKTLNHECDLASSNNTDREGDSRYTSVMYLLEECGSVLAWRGRLGGPLLPLPPPPASQIRSTEFLQLFKRI